MFRPKSVVDAAGIAHQEAAELAGRIGRTFMLAPPWSEVPSEQAGRWFQGPKPWEVGEPPRDVPDGFFGAAAPGIDLDEARTWKMARESIRDEQRRAELLGEAQRRHLAVAVLEGERDGEANATPPVPANPDDADQVERLFRCLTANLPAVAEAAGLLGDSPRKADEAVAPGPPHPPWAVTRTIDAVASRLEEVAGTRWDNLAADVLPKVDDLHTMADDGATAIYTVAMPFVEQPSEAGVALYAPLLSRRRQAPTNSPRGPWSWRLVYGAWRFGRSWPALALSRSPCSGESTRLSDLATERTWTTRGN
jgi:hypothetical protein